MISDFGLSKMEEHGVMSTACGTPGYVGENDSHWQPGNVKAQKAAGFDSLSLKALWNCIHNIFNFCNVTFLWVMHSIQG